MTVAILRFELAMPVNGDSFASMPEDARVVSVGSKDGEISVWAECPVPATGPDEARRFRVFATGSVFEPTLTDGLRDDFLGTVQVPSPMVKGGIVVWHVFEVVYA